MFLDGHVSHQALIHDIALTVVNAPGWAGTGSTARWPEAVATWQRLRLEFDQPSTCHSTAGG
jgi:hypothetical protein